MLIDITAGLPSLIIILWETINCWPQYCFEDAETKSSDLSKAYGKLSHEIYCQTTLFNFIILYSLAHIITRWIYLQ